MLKQKKKRSRQFKNSEKVIDLEEARQQRRQKRKAVAEKKQSLQNPESSLSERKINKKNRKRLIYFFIVLGIIAVIGVSVFHVYMLQKEFEEIEAVNKELNDKKASLQEELENVNNPEYIEQQARDQLRMVMPGEILYILPPDGASTVTEQAVTGEWELLPAGDAED